MADRIRFIQFDVPRDTVHGPDSRRGFPIPVDDGQYAPWKTFQVEFRGSLIEGHVRLAVWQRLADE